MGKGKNKGQSVSRKLRRGNMDQFGNSLSRPFNNSKRTKNSVQLEREKFYFGMKDYLEHLKRTTKDESEDNTEKHT